jgi:CheY-like chemotaxis protein
MTEDDRRIVRVAGSLRIAHLPELLVACADSAALDIDLSDLISADVAGIEALRRIRAKGARLVGMHGYIKMKIDSTGTFSE